MQKLQRHFYARDTVDVAHDLLGKFLVHEQEQKNVLEKLLK